MLLKVESCKNCVSESFLFNILYFSVNQTAIHYRSRNLFHIITHIEKLKVFFFFSHLEIILVKKKNQQEFKKWNPIVLFQLVPFLMVSLN